MLPVLLGLGTWQVQRLHWKQALLATINERVHDTPVGLPLANDIDADFRPAKASGVFRHDLQIFVFATNRATGQGGYHVVTPLQLAGGAFLLVDRGWIPYERQKKVDGFSRPSGTVEIQGLLRLSGKPGLFSPANNPAKGEWYGVDVPAIAAADQLDGVLPYVLEADEMPNEGGFPIGGQTQLTLPNDHFSYAVTWYSFAAILLIIYGLSSYRKNNAD